MLPVGEVGVEADLRAGEEVDRDNPGCEIDKEERPPLVLRLLGFEGEGAAVAAGLA